MIASVSPIGTRKDLKKLERARGKQFEPRKSKATKAQMSKAPTIRYKVRGKFAKATEEYVSRLGLAKYTDGIDLDSEQENNIDDNATI